MVHRRELDGEEVIFGNQGALWGNAMTWWDHDTGSIWSQPLGEAILGPRKGERFELLPSTLTTWEAWQSAHPETLAWVTIWSMSGPQRRLTRSTGLEASDRLPIRISTGCRRSPPSPRTSRPSSQTGGSGRSDRGVPGVYDPLACSISLIRGRSITSEAPMRTATIQRIAPPSIVGRPSAAPTARAPARRRSQVTIRSDR